MSSLLFAMDEEVYHTLSERINISTRSSHAQVNRLIVSRLPLALPPCTSDPSTYVSGLLHIAPIYITFELLWQLILTPCDREKAPSSHHTNLTFLSDTQQQLLKAHRMKTCSSNTQSILSSLSLPGLLRSEHLQSDIKTLTGTSSEQIDEQLRTISENGGTITNFIEHIKETVAANPHVLLAYAWVFYMALFSGGRYIRASLRKAGSEFWSSELPSYNLHFNPSTPEETFRSEPSRSLDESDPSHITDVRSKSPAAAASTLGLHFFHFDGETDGEDIKREFKKRFAEVDSLLSPGEKDDIVQEAQRIFIHMIEMVGELDRICGSADLGTDGAKMAEQAKVQVRGCPFVTTESLSREHRLRHLPRSAPAASQILGHRATSFTVTAKPRNIGQNLREVISPFSGRSLPKASKSMTSNEYQASIKIASGFSIPILISVFVVAWLLYRIPAT